MVCGGKGSGGLSGLVWANAEGGCALLLIDLAIQAAVQQFVAQQPAQGPSHDSTTRAQAGQPIGKGIHVAQLEAVLSARLWRSQPRASDPERAWLRRQPSEGPVVP